MSIYPDLETLRTSLETAGLSAQVEKVIATARPCIIFFRKQVPDDAAAFLKSRLGGDPAIPSAPGAGCADLKGIGRCHGT